MCASPIREGTGRGLELQGRDLCVRRSTSHKGGTVVIQRDGVQKMACNGLLCILILMLQYRVKPRLTGVTTEGLISTNLFKSLFDK